jgi:hypothetical protein
MPSQSCPVPQWLGVDNPDISRLLDNIQTLVQGATTDMVSMQVWNTIEEFYQRSTLRREHVYWKMDPGVYTLNFDPWDGHWRVCRFLQFRGLSHVKFEPPGRIRDLTYPANAERTGEILLALKPVSIEVSLPYDVWTEHFEALLHGSLYRLYIQPQRPWSDPQSAKLEYTLYMRGIQSARAKVQSGNLTDGVLWRFPYFATGKLKGMY